MGKTLLEIQGLKKSYGRKEGETKALNGVSFQVWKGNFWVLWEAAVQAKPHF